MVARLRADCDALEIPGGGLVGVCVSGGADSLALLLLAVAAFERVEAVTVDHRLRPESATEAAFVAGVCRDLGTGHTTLTLGPLAPGNISAVARTARYAAIEDWATAVGCDTIMTAHHADDQAETIVMRLNRGAGLAGLAGIRSRRERLVRPLLTWRARDLAEIVRASGLTPVDDPSNHDDRYDRARLRKSLAAANWLDPIALSRSAAALAEAQEALDWTSRREFDARVAVAGAVIVLDTPSTLPAELLRRVFLHCVSHFSPDAQPRGEAVARALEALAGGRTVTLAGVKCTGGEACWRFERAPVVRPLRARRAD